jgi:hypothetical protein
MLVGKQSLRLGLGWKSEAYVANPSHHDRRLIFMSLRGDENVTLLKQEGPFVHHRLR